MKHVSELRKERGWTQAELANRLSISQQAISKYEKESRDPDIDVLIRIAKLFNVSTDFLLGITNEKTSDKQNEYVLDEFSSERLCQLIEEDSVSDIAFYSQISKIPIETLKEYITGMRIPSTYDLCKLVEVLDTSADYLFGKSDIPHPGSSPKCILNDDFPAILNKEMEGNSCLEVELSEKLDISIFRIKQLLSGQIKPDTGTLFQLAQIFKKSTDYLLGITDKSRCSDFEGTYPFDMNDKSLERLQSLLESDKNDYIAGELGLKDEELYLLYHYGFIPHVDVLRKLCKGNLISADYILGLSNSKLCIISEKNNDEDSLLSKYRELEDLYKKKVDGFIAEQLLQQERDSYMRSSVAVDEQYGKRIGNENSGKSSPSSGTEGDLVG